MRVSLMIEGQEGVTWQQWCDLADACEEHGVATLYRSDHYISQANETGSVAHDAWTTLAALAARTTTLRFGTLVSPATFRLPGLLANAVATVDHVSGGRIELGLGGGWMEREHRAYGFPFPETRVRLEMFAEQLEIVHRLWTEDRVDFRGRHYTLEDAPAQPKPVQLPHPPIFVGGGGRRILSLAGREADIVGLAPRILPGDEPRTDPRSLTLEAAAEKIGWVREAAGDRFDRLEFNTYPSTSEIVVTDHALPKVRELADRLRARTGIEITERELLDSPHIFIGSIDGLVEKFRMLRERLGISSIMVGGIDELAPVVERLKGT